MSMSPRLLRPRASGFDPRSIAGIVHWWDANDAASVSITGAPAGVQTWTSKAGAKTVASQTTPENRPTTTTVNGKTALLFDGSNDILNFTGAARTDETWMVAAAQTADQDSSRAIISDGVNGYGIIISKGAQKLVDCAWGGFTQGTNRLIVSYSLNAATLYGPAVATVVRSAGAGGFVFIDGTQRTGTTGFTSFSTSPSVTIQRIGASSSSSQLLQGWIGEVLCWNRALTAVERLSAERYLGKKWGITVA
jgi:hypothetical protein